MQTLPGWSFVFSKCTLHLSFYAGLCFSFFLSFYWQEHFAEDSNPRGSCEYAPDCVRSAVDYMTCISCAQCMLYHCMADEEGEFVQQPCDCNPVEENWLARRRRWIGLALLSLIVPCLCCYPPLRACHWCCVRCGVCGGKHEESDS